MVLVDVFERFVPVIFTLALAPGEIPQADWPRFTPTLSVPHLVLLSLRLINGSVSAQNVGLAVGDNVHPAATRQIIHELPAGQTTTLTGYYVFDAVKVGVPLRVWLITA